MQSYYGLIAASVVHLLQETAVAVSNGKNLRGYAQTLASYQTPTSGQDERPPIVRRHDPDDEEDEGPSLESDVELERRRGRGRGRSGGRRRRGRGGRRRRRGRGSFRSRRGRRFRGSRRGRSFRRGRRFSRRRGGFGGSRRCIDRCLDRPNRSSRSCESRCGFSSESIVDLFYATGGFSEPPPTDGDLRLYLSATPSTDPPVNVPSDDGEFDDYGDEPDYFDDEFDDDDFEVPQ